jgi:hypothetical protein
VINFRYHVVSLTAVFLAVAFGLVVGTAAFNGPALEELKDRVSSISKTNDGLRDQVSHLKEESQQEEQWATDSMPYLFADKLAGRRVLLLEIGDPDKAYADGMVLALGIAGAKITGRVEIQKRFVEPANKDELLDLSDRTVPPGLTGLPANSNGVETSSALLAAVLLDHSPTLSADDRHTVISAYRIAGYLTLTPDVSGPAEAVVVLAGDPYADKDAAKLNGGLKVLVEQFRKAGPMVLGASSTGGDGNLVAAVRSDSTLGKQVSTVDYIAAPQGRAAAVLALIEQFAGRSGHYGHDSGAVSLMPVRAAGDKSKANGT